MPMPAAKNRSIEADHTSLRGPRQRLSHIALAKGLAAPTT